MKAGAKTFRREILASRGVSRTSTQHFFSVCEQRAEVTRRELESMGGVNGWDYSKWKELFWPESVVSGLGSGI